MRNRSLLIFLILLPLISPWACSHFFPPPLETSPAAQALLAEAGQRNRQLKTFKGIGSVKLKQDNTRHTARVMWAGDLPNQMIRMEVLEISGRPLISLSNDGEMIYVYIHNSQKYYKTKKSGMSLKRFLSVQITMDDLLVMLAGGIPIRAHDYAQIDASQKESETCLTMKNRWGKVQQKIFWDADRREIKKVELFIPSGEMAYRAEFSGVKRIGDYRFPEYLTISDQNGDGASLRIDRYQTDVDLPAAMFEVHPPETS